MDGLGLITSELFNFEHVHVKVDAATGTPYMSRLQRLFVAGETKIDISGAITLRWVVPL